MLDLGAHGLLNPGPVHANLSAATLIERAIQRGEGVLSEGGTLVVLTGKHTGRSPKDRFIVASPRIKSEVHWGADNLPMEPAVFQGLARKIREYLQGRELFVADCWAAADPAHRLAIRVIAEKAWHALFVRLLLIRPAAEQLALFQPDFTILCAPDLQLDPAADGTHSGAVIALGIEERLILIAGTHYAGEIKKSVFAILNYLLPLRGVLAMHCAANIGADGDSALFFGLSGTGKTTLSADPERRLIGDDEHGWSDDGIFNFEGGCYAKTIALSASKEPQIWKAIRFGSLVENVLIDAATRRLDFDSQHYTENTRAAYPLEHIDNLEPSGRGPHPRNLVFLTCDAFGVLPPISRLTAEQAMYHFLAGYTAKVAGTERGVTAPEATFSTCFGAPFMPLDPTRYADLLQHRLKKHGAVVWLLNTGWSGGPPGQGSRLKLAHTRAMLTAVLQGELATASIAIDPIFGVAVPTACPGVPPEILQPSRTWADPEAYERKARELAQRFHDNFQQFAARASSAIQNAGPKT